MFTAGLNEGVVIVAIDLVRYGSAFAAGSCG